MIGLQSLCPSCNGKRILRGTKSVTLDIMPGICLLKALMIMIHVYMTDDLSY